MNSKPQIYVVEPLGNGGMIHYVYQQCNALAQAGADVTLVTSTNYELDGFPHSFKVNKLLQMWPMFDAKRSEQPRNAFDKLVRKVSWQTRRGWRAITLIQQWVRLTNFLLRERPDIVQFGKIQFPFETIFLTILRKRGLTLTQICHEFEQREKSDSKLAGVTNWLYAGVYPLFSAIFFHAEQNRGRFLDLFGERLGELSADKTHLIPMGNTNLFLNATTDVDHYAKYGLDKDDPVILFFGTVSPSKGVPDLLHAFAKVRQQTNVKLLIAGYHTKFMNSDELFAIVAEHNMANDVIFDNQYIPNEEVGAIMKLATIAALPYRNGTQSAALQVAYAFGKPVVATKVGGLPEAVTHGKNGLLVAPENPAELGDALLQLLADSDMMDAMGKHNKHVSQTRYAWETIAQKMLAVYDPLVAQQSNAQPVTALS